MNIVSFIPLSRNRHLDELSYFCGDELSVGSVYEIPVRNSKLHALLISQQPAKHLKTDLRNRSYNLKSLDSPDLVYKLPAGFISAAAEIASFYASSPGIVLNSWLHKNWLLDTCVEDEILLPDTKPKNLLGRTGTTPPNYWQTMPSDLGLLVERQLRNKTKQIAVIVSDRNQAAMCQGLLEKYQPPVIAGTSTNNAIKKALSKPVVIALRSLGPILSLSTRQIIIINPGGESWREKRWPHYFWDHATTAVCQSVHKPLTLWSPVLDAKNWHIASNTKNKSNLNLIDSYRPKNPLNKKILDRSSGQKTLTDIVFDAYSQSLIRHNHKNQHKTILYVTRRGLYPVLTCQDCRALNYTKKFKEQLQKYQLNSTVSDWLDPSTAEDWTDRCENCGSWRLQPVSLSLEQTKNAILEMVPPESVSVIDTVTQKRSESKKQVDEFYKDPEKTFLLTTQRGVYNCTAPVHSTIVVSLDAALSTSSLNVESDMLRLLYYLEHISQSNFLLQTRLENNRAIETFDTGSIRKFQNTSLSERSTLHFPPFYTQIKITLPPDHQLPHQDSLKKLVKHDLDGEWSQLPGVTKKKIILITMYRDMWQSDKSSPLKNYLSNISTKYHIAVNPDIII